MENDKYILKIDIRKFFESISTEELREIRDEAKAILKERAKDARRNTPRPKPEYQYWTGRVKRRIGSALCHYKYIVEPENRDGLPIEADEEMATYFQLASGSFKKSSCPKVGDKVVCKYRVIKRLNSRACFFRSRVISLAPKTVVGCKREWNCLNIVAYNDKSHCQECLDAIKE